MMADDFTEDVLNYHPGRHDTGGQKPKMILAKNAAAEVTKWDICLSRSSIDTPCH